MAVPTGAGMSLKDVKNEIESNSSATVTSLNDAFSDSVEDGFNNTYYDGTKDELQDFQGYSHVVVKSLQIPNTGRVGAVSAEGETDIGAARSETFGSNTFGDIMAVCFQDGDDNTIDMYRGFVGEFDLNQVPSDASVTKVILWAKILHNYGPELGMVRSTYNSEFSLSAGDYDTMDYDFTRTSPSGSSEVFLFDSGDPDSTGPGDTNRKFQDTDYNANLEASIGSKLEISLHSSGDLTGDGPAPDASQGWVISPDTSTYLEVEYTQ